MKDNVVIVGGGPAGIACAIKLQKAGIQNVDLKLYPNDRHEILNETDKLDVYFDLYKWLEAKLTLR